MEKESKQPKLGTPEAKRELDALHKLMRRYTAGGDLTAEELHLLDKVAVSDERTSPGKEPETKNAGRRILRRVYAATVPHDGRQTAAVRKIRPVSRLYRYGVVATFLLLVGVSAVIGFRALERTPQLVELAALQEVEEFTLPDGSRIYLNRGSKLTYDDRTFNDERREIRLSGEAFFEVAKNPAKPFIVYGGQTQTTVRGTSFNVKVYPGVRENVISVRDGRVEVKNAEHEVLADYVGHGDADRPAGQYRLAACRRMERRADARTQPCRTGRNKVEDGAMLRCQHDYRSDYGRAGQLLRLLPAG